MSTRPGTGRDVAMVLGAAALFGTVGTARVLGPEASAWSLGAARLACAALLLVLLAVRAGSRSGVGAALRLPGTGVAGAGQASFQVCFLAAVASTGVAVGTLLAIGSAPLWAGLLTRRVTRAWWTATAMAGSGLVLLVLAGQEVRLAPLGVVAALGAGLSYAVYLAGSERVVAAGVAPVPAVAAAFTVAAVLLAPALVLGDLAWVTSPEGVALVVYLAVGPTLIAYLLLYAGLGGLPPSTVATLGLAEPVVATVLGVLVLGEVLQPAGVVGLLLVLAALLVLARASAGPRSRRSRPGGPASGARRR